MLTVVMALSLVVVASATTTKGKVELKVVETNRTTEEVTYTVTLEAGANHVAALQFELTPPAGMTYKSRTLEDFGSVFMPANSVAVKGNFDFTTNTGVYIAYGGDATKDGRYLTGTQKIMTVTYSINESTAGSLTVPEFKACESGSQAMENPYECVRPQPAGLLGDVNGNGEVNIIDLQRLYAHLNGSNKLGSDAWRGDVDRNGEVNIIDFQRLYAHLNGSNKLF